MPEGQSPGKDLVKPAGMLAENKDNTQLNEVLRGQLSSEIGNIFETADAVIAKRISPNIHTGSILKQIFAVRPYEPHDEIDMTKIHPRLRPYFDANGFVYRISDAEDGPRLLYRITTAGGVFALSIEAFTPEGILTMTTRGSRDTIRYDRVVIERKNRGRFGGFDEQLGIQTFYPTGNREVPVQIRRQQHGLQAYMNYQALDTYGGITLEPTQKVHGQIDERTSFLGDFSATDLQMSWRRFVTNPPQVAISPEEVALSTSKTTRIVFPVIDNVVNRIREAVSGFDISQLALTQS